MIKYMALKRKHRKAERRKEAGWSREALSKAYNKKNASLKKKDKEWKALENTLTDLQKGESRSVESGQASLFSKDAIKRFLLRTHRKGLKRFTIMLIPHTQKRIVNWHVSMYSLCSLGLGLGLVMFFSVISLIDKSGDDIKYYDMGLGNKQFGMQSIHIAKEMLPLHKLIRSYSKTIAMLYGYLDDKKTDKVSLSPKATRLIRNEIAKLERNMKKCEAAKAGCPQNKIEELLRSAIYLASQDNHSIRKSIEYTEKILAALATKEKKHLFENTPSIWPAQGYLLSPYGQLKDPLRGRTYFKRGIEIGAFLGTEVVATAPGIVHKLSYDPEYGLKLFVKHLYGIASFYAHLDRVRVKEGDRVDKGEVIGYVGKSGKAPIPMLYYELHIGTVAYDPHAFLHHLQNRWLIPPKI